MVVRSLSKFTQVIYSSGPVFICKATSSRIFVELAALLVLSFQHVVVSFVLYTKSNFPSHCKQGFAVDSAFVAHHVV